MFLSPLKSTRGPLRERERAVVRVDARAALDRERRVRAEAEVRARVVDDEARVVLARLGVARARARPVVVVPALEADDRDRADDEDSARDAEPDREADAVL